MFKFMNSSSLTNRQILAKKILGILSTVYLNSPWSYDQILSELMKPEIFCQLAFDERNILVGFLTAQFLDGEAEITNIAVLPAYQQQEIATNFLAILIENFDGVIFLEVRSSNMSARKLYEKFNFATFYVRKNYYQHPREDALLMKRER